MTLCACGKPLHYSNAATRAAIEELVAELGENLAVTCEGRTYLVPRHYIALHGIVARELPSLAAKYGWTEQTS